MSVQSYLDSSKQQMDIVGNTIKNFYNQLDEILNRFRRNSHFRGFQI